MPDQNQTHRKKQEQQSVESLEEQILVMREKIQQMQDSDGQLDTADLIDLANANEELQYRESTVDRLYKRKGLLYGVAVKIPLKLMNVSSLSDSQRFMRDSYRGVASPMCVMCNYGMLMHNPNQVPVDGNVRWFCSNEKCSYIVWAAPADKDLLMLDIRSKIGTNHNQAGIERWKSLTEKEKSELITSHLSKARTFRNIAIVLVFIALLELFLQLKWAFIFLLPILFLDVLLSLNWGFRAWQTKTGNVFLAESKFLEWLKTADKYYSVDWVDDDKNSDKGGSDA